MQTLVVDGLETQRDALTAEVSSWRPSLDRFFCQAAMGLEVGGLQGRDERREEPGTACAAQRLPRSRLEDAGWNGGAAHPETEKSSYFQSGLFQNAGELPPRIRAKDA